MRSDPAVNRTRHVGSATHAVSLDQAADISRFLKSMKDLQKVIIGDICVGTTSSLCRIMSKALWVENENPLQKIVFVLDLRDKARLLS